MSPVVPDRPLEYASPPPTRKPLGGVRTSLVVVGFGWFGLMVFLATLFFVLRGLGDVPGHNVTVGEALGLCAAQLAVGLPGLAIAVGAVRFRR